MQYNLTEEQLPHEARLTVCGAGITTRVRKSTAAKSFYFLPSTVFLRFRILNFECVA
jgi:hypothetical protein